MPPCTDEGRSHAENTPAPKESFRSSARTNSMRQSFSALVSSSFQDLSSRRGRHSLSETVHLASRSLFGLIRSFHFLITPFVYRFFSILFLKSLILRDFDSFLQGLFHSDSFGKKLFSLCFGRTKAEIESVFYHYSATPIRRQAITRWF